MPCPIVATGNVIIFHQTVDRDGHTLPSAITLRNWVCPELWHRGRQRIAVSSLQCCPASVTFCYIVCGHTLFNQYIILCKSTQIEFELIKVYLTHVCMGDTCIVFRIRQTQTHVSYTMSRNVELIINSPTVPGIDISL